MSAEGYKAAARRAAGFFDNVGTGVPKVDSSTAQNLALVEMMLHDVHDGQISPPMFLQHPAHLPEGGELKVLLASTAEKDKQLKLDAIEWRDVNRREAVRASATLRNAITAIRLADEALNGGLHEDVEKEVHAWMTEIRDYVYLTFACDPSTAPFEPRELDAWCFLQTNKANPVPEWLQTGTTFGATPPKPKTFGVSYWNQNDD